MKEIKWVDVTVTCVCGEETIDAEIKKCLSEKVT